MRVLEVRNVNEALCAGVLLLRSAGRQEETRYAKALVYPAPVITVYSQPRERVLFWPERDANPFFHLFEALWMLAGRRDVAFVEQFAKRMREFSDDGEIFHGAYGYRWRDHFGTDQLRDAIAELRRDPLSRRVVVQMWDPRADLGRQGKDLPCNTNVYLRGTPNGTLDMTVCCRSNDIVWGAYGANAVHFSFLQEYVACALGMGVGTLYQISNNYHGYLKTLEPIYGLSARVGHPSPYEKGDTSAGPSLFSYARALEFDHNLRAFLERPERKMDATFLNLVALPLWEAWQYHKEGDYGKALEAAQNCVAPDWRLGAREWLQRRADKRVAA